MNVKSVVTLQEAAVENVGPVDDGTESLGDAPSLSEEVTGIDLFSLQKYVQIRLFKCMFLNLFCVCV